MLQKQMLEICSSCLPSVKSFFGGCIYQTYLFLVRPEAHRLIYGKQINSHKCIQKKFSAH